MIPILIAGVFIGLSIAALLIMFIDYRAGSSNNEPEWDNEIESFL